MSLKLFLFMAPVAVGGYVLANRPDAAPAGNETAAASARAASATPRKSSEECRVLMEQLFAANPPAPDNPFQQMAVVRGVERELRNQGCDTRGGGFAAPSNRMGNAPRPAMAPAREDGTSFETGRPMVDVSRGNTR